MTTNCLLLGASVILYVVYVLDTQILILEWKLSVGTVKEVGVI